MIVVSNASPIIILSRIGLFALLRSLFHEVHIPAPVYDEVVTQGEGRPGSTEVEDALTVWLHAKSLSHTSRLHGLPTTLTPTDRAVLQCAQELKAHVILTDDLMLRRAGLKLGFAVSGVGGILLKAKRASLIPSVGEPLAAALKQGLRVSEALQQELLRAAGESE